VVILWRAGLRISEALALAESDLDPSRGAQGGSFVRPISYPFKRLTATYCASRYSSAVGDLDSCAFALQNALASGTGRGNQQKAYVSLTTASTI
jgi:hypothetical protein